MRIAILGGTFDPIHKGHTIIAETVINELGYNKVLFIPASIPPHKKISGKVSDKDRLNMVMLATSNNSKFEVCDYEIKSGGTSYTIDTLKYLYSSCKDIEGKVGLIIGYDLVACFSKWRDADKIAERTDIIVVNRIANNTKLENLENIAKYNMTTIKSPNIDISSTMIREYVAEGKSTKDLLDLGVYEYIKKNNLYK